MLNTGSHAHVRLLRRSGFALAAVLWITLVLVMLSGVMVQRLRAANVFSLEGQGDSAASWAAQAGVSYALARWDAHKDWATSVVNAPLPGSEATFSIHFGPGGSGDSVCNLEGAAAADSELGPASVPAGRAYLVVTGNFHGHQQKLTALVGRAGLKWTSNSALLATGPIDLSGRVKIRGYNSSDGAALVTADLVSTSAANATLVQASGQVTVEGAVRTASTNPSAIQHANITASKGFQTGSSVTPPPDPGIAARVAAASTSAVHNPTMSAGNTTLGSGKFYFPAGLNYNGNLKLDGSNLYVEGPVNITGSVSGTGTLFTTGSASLKGNASLEAADPHGLALYAQGDVTLSGIDGSAYLNGLATAAGGNLVHDVSDSVAVLKMMQQAVEAPDNSESTLFAGSGRKRFGNPSNINDAATQSDHDLLNDFLVGDSETLGQSSLKLPSGRFYKDSFGMLDRMRQLVTNDNSGHPVEKQFLLDRLNALHTPGSMPRGLLAHHLAGMQGFVDDLNSNLAQATTDGLSDSLNDLWNVLLPSSTDARLKALAPSRQALRQHLVHTYDTFSLSGLGTASFRGQIYCGGNLTCRGDLQVIGSVAAAGTSSAVSLQDCAITYVPELAEQAGSSLGQVAVLAWFRP